MQFPLPRKEKIKKIKQICPHHSPKISVVEENKSANHDANIWVRLEPQSRPMHLPHKTPSSNFSPSPGSRSLRMPNSRRKGGGGGWRRAVPALQLGLRGEGIQRRTPIIPPLSLPTMQTKSTTPNLGAWEKGPVGSLACGMDGWRRWPKWSSCCSRLRVGVAGDCPLPARGRLTPKAAEAAGWRAGNPPFPVGLGEPQAAAENGGVGGWGEGRGWLDRPPSSGAGSAMGARRTQAATWARRAVLDGERSGDTPVPPP